MNSSFIDKCLHKKFESHKYQLSNSFVYSEESDFFSVTATGYAQEIEVKISRSDFKADFKKKKHNDFKQIYKGQKLVLRVISKIFNVTEPIMKNSVGVDGKGIWVKDKYGRKRPKKEASGKFRTYEIHNLKEKRIKEIKKSGGNAVQVSTAIRIFRPKTPNKFWYAVPDGLIGVNEVPEYAGLFYISEQGKVTVVKRAPFIHKEKEDLKQVLLDKFYYLSQKYK